MQHRFHYLFTLLCTLFLLQNLAQAQGIVWGSPVSPQVQVDVTNGIKLSWSNRWGTDPNGFSPPRFYHVWVEQLQSGVWVVPADNAHYFVSDTTWIADATRPLGDNPVDSIRFRIAPFRLVSTTPRLQPGTTQQTTSTTDLVEFPTNTITSVKVSPTANTASFCCITIIVDTRTATPNASNRLGLVATNPSTIKVYDTNNNPLPVFGSWSPSVSNLGNKEPMLDTKQDVNNSTVPLLYSNSTTSICISTKGLTTSAAIRAVIDGQLKLLLPAVRERLKTAGYASYDDYAVRLVVSP